MSFNCSLSNAKISVSVIVSGKWKTSASAKNFGIAPQDVLVYDILASIEDGLRGIFPSEATWFVVKWFQPHKTISEVDQFWLKKNTWRCKS